MNIADYVKRMIDLYENDYQTCLTLREKTLIEKSFIVGLHFGQKWLNEDQVNIQLIPFE